MKVSLFSKMLWRQYLLILSCVSVFASLTLVAVEIPVKLKPPIFVGIVILLVLFYIILWVIANGKNFKRCGVNGSMVEVRIGNIFEEGQLRAINFNEYFDTVVDDVLIARSSLNGEFLKDYAGDVSSLDEAIDSDSHLAKMVSGEESARVCGKKIRYKLGSVHVSGSYLLVAFSKFDKDNKAHLFMRDYINCLMTFWEEVDRVYAGRSVAIPLMGAGITRFKDANVSEQELLELLIWSFKVSRVKFKRPAKVIIVIHKSMKDKINFYELKG